MLKKMVRVPIFVFSFLIFSGLLLSCNTQTQSDARSEQKQDAFSRDVSSYISEKLMQIQHGDDKLNDSLRFEMMKPVLAMYRVSEYLPVWSAQGKWQPFTHDLMQVLSNVKKHGLFESDYQFKQLANLKLLLDSNVKARQDNAAWALADIAFTNAFMHLQQDLKQGRIVADSARLQNLDSLIPSFFIATTNRLIEGANLDSLLTSLQPSLPAYKALKQCIPAFVDSMDTKEYTYLAFPATDSSAFIKKLNERLMQSNIIHGKFKDSAQIASAIKSYQQKKGLKVDGKISSGLVKALNNTDIEKFKRIALTLDRYKMLPDTMPAKYIWVNLPAYYLHVMEGDSIVLESKIICGKPGTPTPLITSLISDIIVYPTWTVPASIIQKDIIPGMKRSSNYLARKGLHLVNNRGEHIDARRINWARYTTGIPYMVQQPSGDNNALGIIKFNFANPYAVYLHDTNQRYLYNQKQRALSHGCVRVKEFKMLADYIAKNDSLHLPAGDTVKYNADSITNWLALKKMHKIPVRSQLPLFIRYIGCEGKANKIEFYDDVYGEDKVIRDRYFAKRD